MDLRPFQRRFLRAALAPGIVDTSALSMARRGNGKSWLAAHVLTRCLTPGDPLWAPGKEFLLGAGSIEQARIVFQFVRADLEPTGEYRFIDSTTRLGIVHKGSNTRLRVISSNGKTAMGIVNCPLMVCDEPGSWEVNGGQLMNDAIQLLPRANPTRPLRVLYIGTLAPARAGWWHELIGHGSTGSTHVTALQGDADKWDSWAEIRRCNPLTAVSADFRKKLLEERDAARADSRLKARFLSYRLNIPTADEATMLLTPDDWRQVLERETPDADGRPVVGVDLGNGRAWSAAVALWDSGRVEALAVAPGIPDLTEQERRDRAPKGIYERLQQQGTLITADGLRVQTVGQVVEAIQDRWGKPAVIICDRFRLAELQDAAPRGVKIMDRVTRWSEAAGDIRALRKMARDGPLAADAKSAGIIEASLSVAMVQNDDAGNTRLTKRDASNNTGRDDVSAALLLAAGEVQRRASKPKSAGVYLGLA